MTALAVRITHMKSTEVMSIIGETKAVVGKNALTVIECNISVILF